MASEINTVAASQGWAVAYPNIYVMLMPKGVGNCASTSSGTLEGYCTFGGACSWHHEWGSLYFMVVPDPATTGGCERAKPPTQGEWSNASSGCAFQGS